VLRSTPVASATVISIKPPGAGSRRRRIWELGTHAHCPVVGVCLPMRALRRLVDKVLDGEAIADDYELHCGVIAQCKQRTPVADAMQRELDRRYGIAVRQAAKAKTTEALAAWWQESLRCQDVAGALWATLTHARCTPEIENRVLADVHMLQHQVGMAARVDLDRFEALLDESAALAKELGEAQQRSARQAAEHARRSAQLVRLRAELIGRDSLIAALREDASALEAAIPGLKTRFELARQCERQLERIQDLERGLLQARQETHNERGRADEAVESLKRQRAQPVGDEPTVGIPPVTLHARAVLCVGGRTASVPIYRQSIERVGGRFLHHDGGEEDSVARLDASLSAADLVICQTGCISHDAYWRVKDHCKRTGKPCVFVEKPSRANLERALRTPPPPRTAQAIAPPPAAAPAVSNR